MNSRIFVGEIRHSRRVPVEHSFSYPVYLYAFDVDELAHIEKECQLFGHNRFSAVSIHDKDYLGNGGGSLRSKVEKFLAAKDIHDPIARIELVTSARYFNYVFNPVSFFYCYLADGSLRSVLAEVKNTFKETHLYILDEPILKEGGGGFAHFKAKKEFHVSPFFNLAGEYEFIFSDIRRHLDIFVNLVKEGSPVLLSHITGKSIPLTTGSLIKTLFRFPLSVFLTIPRIAYQAFKLRFMKKLSVIPKPNPTSPMTIKLAPPTFLQTFCMNLVFGYLSKIQYGCLKVLLPDGTARTFGSGDEVEIRVKNYNVFTQLVASGDVGMGESYVEGDCDSSNMVGVLELFAENTDPLNDHHVALSFINRWVNRWLHRGRRNTLRKSAENIEDHYDLGNDFFRTFLDKSLMYSCAYYKSSHDTLEEAQVNKLDMIIQKAKLSKADHVLEIGSGWGAFAIHAAKKTGCKVTTITISRAQYQVVRERVKEEGLSGQIEVKLCDYREMHGGFDKIISIEMLEAVGHEYYGDFFRACDRLLKPNGIMVIQTITIPDQRYDDYRSRTDWIQKHIFPGGNLPSVAVLSNVLWRDTDFIIENLENIGIHYARTLREWRERFHSKWDEIRDMGFDERFRRKWDYYFSYCEAGFATRHLSDLQLVITRPNNKRLDD